MKKLLLALFLFLAPSFAFAQCTGVFPPNTICGNLTGVAAPPSAQTASSVVGPGVSVVGHFATWANTTGSLLADFDLYGNANTWTAANIFTSTLRFSGLSPGTQTKCLGLDSSNNVAYVATACGSVTSVATSGGITGGPITTTGTVALGQTRPGGRLTLTTLTPVLTATVSGATTLFYTPYQTDLVPIFDGSATWTTFVVAELSVAMASSANWASGSIYDWFVINDSGTRRLCSGPAWTSGTGRGTGAGTTQLSLQNGIFLNTVSITCRYGAASTVTAGALTATYVGTTLMTGNGATGFVFGASASGGTAGVFAVWNAYNRVRFTSTVTDSGSNYTYSSATIRQANASAGNQTTLVIGLPADSISVSVSSTIGTTSSNNSQGKIGIGVNTTSAFSLPPVTQVTTLAGTSLVTTPTVSGGVGLAIGLNVISSNEQSDGSFSNVFNRQSEGVLSVSSMM